MPTSSDLWKRGAILGSGRAKPNHEGSYTCIVANAKGKDRATFKLEVLEELRVSILPQHQVINSFDTNLKSAAKETTF